MNESNQKTDGGPAFPMAYTEGTASCSPVGMTLRDYFAAKALQAMISTSAAPCMSLGDLQGIEPRIAESAYSVADAMLAERAK